MIKLQLMMNEHIHTDRQTDRHTHTHTHTHYVYEHNQLVDDPRNDTYHVPNLQVRHGDGNVVCEVLA